MAGCHHRLNGHEFEWTWSWYWTGRPAVLQSVGLQRVGHDWVTELNWTEDFHGFAPLPCVYVGSQLSLAVSLWGKQSKPLPKLRSMYVTLNDLISSLVDPFNLRLGSIFLCPLLSSLPYTLTVFIFWPCYIVCGILVPQPWIEPAPPALKHGILSTGLPGKSWGKSWDFIILVLSGVPVCDESPSDILFHISIILILQQMLSSNM